ncbi:MAG: hypothetical protein PUG09_08855 [Prevotella sp.]|nr:hypothetical protein [Prevotella sp.]
MKEYIKPNTTVVNLNLTGSILESQTIAGQSLNPVDKNVDPGDVENSAKGQGLFDSENEGWTKGSSPWD